MAVREPPFEQVVRDPAVHETFERGGPVGVFAPHGGGIEPGTEELARAVARSCGATLYVLSAKRSSGNGALHVTSTAMRPGVSRALDAALAACRLAIALHGHAHDARSIFVSGRAGPAAARAAAALRAAIGARWEVVDDPARIPPGLGGVAAENFVNRPAGGGVQIELPRALRAEARLDPENRAAGALRGDALLLVRALAGLVRALAAD
jgi:phage replication-related protein YjqB (UPF0714/DUF867 family)